MALAPTLYSTDRQNDAITELNLARATYMQEYVSLEQALASLFAHLSDTSDKVAGIIFFRIASARARLTILDKLMREKYGTKWRTYFNSLIKNLGIVDQGRNEIAHWGVLLVLQPDSNVEHQMCCFGSLQPQNIWDHSSNQASLTASDIRERTEVADFYARSIHILLIIMKGEVPAEHVAPYLDIYQSPSAYPPPDTHPLSRNYVAPENQPRSSPQ